MNERGWKSLTVAIMVVMAALFAFQMFAPKPGSHKSLAQRAEEEAKAKRSIRDLRERVAKLQKANDDRLWKGSSDELGAGTMAFVSKAAAANGLKVIAFRPQRSEVVGELTRYAYLVALEGPFPRVVSFVDSIERPKTKMAVGSVQFSSADGATDRVSASVSVVAFRESEKK